jgi:hypothetical protein
VGSNYGIDPVQGFENLVFSPNIEYTTNYVDTMADTLARYNERLRI